MSETARAGEHLRGITEEMAALVRDEVARVRDEALANVRGAGRDLALVGVAGAAGLAALFAGTVAAIDLLHGGTPPRRAGLPLWAAAGTVAGIAGGVGATLIGVALGGLRKRGALPRQAMHEVGRTAETVVHEMGANR